MAAPDRKSLEAIAAVRAGLGPNPTSVEAAAATEAALKLGAGPRSSPFARVQEPCSCLLPALPLLRWIC